MHVQIGYRTVNSTEFRALTWHPSDAVGAKRTDGRWGCPDASLPYPAMHHSLVHPCASRSGPSCCGHAYAAFDLRFQSFVTAPQGMLLMAYEVRQTAKSMQILWMKHVQCLGTGAAQCDPLNADRF